MAVDDPALTHKLLKCRSKVTSLVAAIRRGIADAGQRARLEQLVLEDMKRWIEKNVPDEIGHRFYANVRGIMYPRARMNSVPIDHDLVRETIERLGSSR